MTALPSVKQCREFLATINRGRVAIDLDPLDVLDFDGAVPDDGNACLSATNLFAAAGCTVGATTVSRAATPDFSPPAELCVVLNAGYELPASILAVTDPFDDCSVHVHGSSQALAALRARMVEAGVVAP